MKVTVGLRRQDVGAEVARRVVTLAGEDDDRAVVATNDQRLVASGVARRRHDEHPGLDLCLPVELLVAKTGDVNQLGKGVVRGGSRGLELPALYKEPPSDELGVAAAVVKVQMAVDDELDVFGSGADGGECIAERSPPWPVVSVDLRMPAHPGVEQQHPAGVIDEVAETRLDPRLARAGLGGGAHKVSEVHPPDDWARHASSLPHLRQIADRAAGPASGDHRHSGSEQAPLRFQTTPRRLDLVTGSVWGVTPRASIEAACSARGRDDVVAGCIALLSGAGADAALVKSLGGPEADWYLSAGPQYRYWLRVWGARGLLWAWDDAAAPATIAALDDDAWRVREMAAKVVGRHLVDDAIPALEQLRDDPVPRVRVAASRALLRFTQLSR
jgi:hypothetical protein